MLYLLLIVAVMVVDRVVKIAVAGHMHPGESIPVIEHIFHITYVQNTGAAFSMLQGHPLLLIVVPGAVILFGIIFVLVMAKEYNRVFLCSLSLICGGGLGNLTDRIAQGYVIDMFDFRIFPVFNVADICVCVGCGLLMLYMIIYANTDKGKQKAEQAAEAGRAKAGQAKVGKAEKAKAGQAKAGKTEKVKSGQAKAGKAEKAKAGKAGGNAHSKKVRRLDGGRDKGKE